MGRLCKFCGVRIHGGFFCDALCRRLHYAPKVDGPPRGPRNYYDTLDVWAKPWEWTDPPDSDVEDFDLGLFMRSTYRERKPLLKIDTTFTRRLW